MDEAPHGGGPMSAARETFSVTAEYKKGTVHNVYGRVTISVAPASTFSFRSESGWPANNHDQAVREGILDALSEIDS
jgi:hypothetical protein